MRSTTVIVAIGAFLSAPGFAAADTKPAPMPAEIAVRHVTAPRDALVYTDAQGMTLYLGRGCPGGACLSTWQPVLASADARPVGDWSVVDRPDGGRQWALKGKGVYRFTGDKEPGSTQGDLMGYWRIAFYEAPLPKSALAPGLKFQKYKQGWVFANPKGFSLYTQAPTAKACTDEACLSQWKPVPAAAMATPTGDWSIFKRADGSRQWSYRGQPVFTSGKDANPGDVTSDDPAWRPLLPPEEDKPVG